MPARDSRILAARNTRSSLGSRVLQLSISAEIVLIGTWTFIFCRQEF